MAKLEIQDIEGEIRAAYFLTRDGNYREARNNLREILATLAAADIQSGYIFWLAAIAADGLGLISEAAELIDRACERDPACPQFLNSQRIIYGHAATTAASPAPACRSWN